jgi:hypothetical protein
VSEPLVPAWTVQGSRRVEVRATVTRADGRVEDLGLVAGTEADGAPMQPDPRPVGVEHFAAVVRVTEMIERYRYEPSPSLALVIVDELFRYGPIVPDDTPGARTSLVRDDDGG